MRALLAALLLALAGCSLERLELPAEFRPLTSMSEGNPVSKSGAATLGTVVYVQDMDDWRDRMGTVRVRAMLLHEREHAIRQHELGVGVWLARYATSRSFAWREERAGWVVQIQQLQAGGELVSPEALAALIHDYWHPLGKLVSYAEALQFVRDVLAGRTK